MRFGAAVHFLVATERRGASCHPIGQLPDTRHRRRTRRKLNCDMLVFKHVSGELGIQDATLVM